jgi:hypothetical protein
MSCDTLSSIQKVQIMAGERKSTTKHKNKF